MYICLYIRHYTLSCHFILYLYKKILIIAALNQEILISSPIVCGMWEKSGRNMSQAAVMKMTD